MGAGSPLPMLITFAVTTSINQLGKGPSASLYFHFGYNNGDIDFKKGSEPIFKKFDDFKILYSTREIKFEDIVVTSPREIFVIVHNNNTKMLEVIKS